MVLNKEYWENRYESATTNWDIGEISTPLKEYIDQLKDKNSRILIPGAGNAYELDYLIENGFQNVFVIDYAKHPLDAIINRNKSLEKHLIHDDFFNHNGTYDLILEQTFFCALDPSLRQKYVTHMYNLLSEQGYIVGVFFNINFQKQGPPFGGNEKDYLELILDQHLFPHLARYQIVIPLVGK